jgi:hypothetical protein
VRVKAPEKLYQFHVRNLRSVTDGLEHVFASGREAVARAHQDGVHAHVRLVSFLLGVWSEARLLKLLYEPNGFSELERSRVLNETALTRWQALVELAFRRHYDIPQAELRPPKLPSTAHFRLTKLQEALETDLRAVITMRNKLAHGQWAYPLNDALDDVAQEQMDALRNENLLLLRQKFRLLDILCNVVHDLAVSRRTFERDWDEHFRVFEQTRTNIERKDFATWEAQLRRRYRQGRERLMTAKGGQPAA